MRKFLVFAFLMLSLSVRGHAGEILSFETSINNVRSQVRSSVLSERIRKTAVAVLAETRGAQDLPNRISDLRRRAGDPKDPRLKTDVNDLVIRLRLMREHAASFLAAAQEFRRLANKDMDLVQPAMDLMRVSNALYNKSDLVSREIEEAQAPLRHAGFEAQAQVIRDEGIALLGSSSALASETAQLYQEIVSR